MIDLHLSEIEASDEVIRDDLRFKRKLRIGDDTYGDVRAAKAAKRLWATIGAAKAGAAVAGSSAVATTFFGSSASLLSVFGLGAAATTPVGWVIAAALATGGVSYGVTQLIARRSVAKSDTIPAFINTPIDILGMQLLDLMGALALRVARIDGDIAFEERQLIQRHFVQEWGYDPSYTGTALTLLEQGVDETRVKEIAQSLAQFQVANPDCNPELMQREIVDFLREIVAADGILDEREELAIDAIEATFKSERAITLAKVGQSLVGIDGRAGAAMESLRTQLSTRLAPTLDEPSDESAEKSAVR